VTVHQTIEKAGSRPIAAPPTVADFIVEPEPLYAEHEKVFPKAVKGTFRMTKWTVMIVTLGVYYLLPWVRWDRAPGLPSQAVLIDLDEQRVWIGPIEIWAQEFFYVTGLLILAALALFLFTSVLGRVWCGYACPQTVWTDLMVAVERFWQGDRNARMKLEAAPWSVRKVAIKGATHASWLLIAIATGGAFVFYFRDAPTLTVELVTGTAPASAYVFLTVFTGTTYVLGGMAREQVCIYMCPWPRIQAAMIDRDTLLVSYRTARGEPRGAHKKGDSWDGRGDCIDCRQCVAVCPTGVDIRDGLQLACIQCALCIDACNAVMDKVGRPRGLIDYTTETAAASACPGPRDGWRLFRLRTVIYAVVITALTGVMAWSLATRGDLVLTVNPERNPLFVTLSDGSLRNTYTLKIVNKREQPRPLTVAVAGVEGARAAVLGAAGPAALTVDAPAANVVSVRLFVTVPAAATRSLTGESTPLAVTVADADGTVAVTRATTFRGPPRVAPVETIGTYAFPDGGPKK
jgi:cytochrome c oxidase accessory protein FixG